MIYDSWSPAEKPRESSWLQVYVEENSWTFSRKITARHAVPAESSAISVEEFQRG